LADVAHSAYISGHSRHPGNHGYAIRQIAKREGFSLEKHGEDSYRLINERLNVIVFGLDGVPLETIASFLEKPESLANSPDAHHR
jgi:hypothetical protein